MSKDNGKKPKNILVISHVNPYGLSSGQSQRVLYTIKALEECFNVTLLFGTYNRKELDNFNSNGRVKSANLKLCTIFSKITLIDKIYTLYEEYIKGLKSSNYFISKLFSVKAVKNTVDLNDYQLVIFEYWHAYKTAGKLKNEFNNLVTICDLHNILSSTYKLYLLKHPFKKYFKKAYFNKYKNIEFKKALNSFDYLITINNEEHNQLVEIFDANKLIFCPMGIDLTSFNSVENYKVKEVFTVLYYGGLGSQHNRDSAKLVYELFIKPAIENGEKIRYVIIGSNAPENFSSEFNSEFVNVLGYSKDIKHDFRSASLAIIPWEGKYGFRSRLIELAACNVPLFTTADAVWGMGFENGSTAFIVEEMIPSTFEWFISLKKNDALLTSVSINAKTFIEDYYSYENTYQKLAQKLNSLAST